MVYGPQRGRFDRTQDGAGRVLAVQAEEDLDAAVAAIETMLLAVLSTDPDEHAALARRAIDMLTANSTLTRVADLANALGLSVRSLHRLFTEYVGVGPGWVTRRYRLHEAVARAARGGRIDWARTAAELGYCDQARLVRGFTAMIGTPPSRYRAASG
jgi:AraC-like DNA-binding protein